MDSIVELEPGLKRSGNELYGSVGGYPVSVIALRYPQITLYLTASQIKSVKKDLKQKLKRISNFIITNNSMVFSLNIKKNNTKEIYQSWKQNTIQVLKEHQVYPPEFCPICHAAGCDSTAMYKQVYQPVHEECFNQSLDKEYSDYKTNEKSGNYLFGLVGGLLGGILAMIPNIITIWFFETAFAILYALIPLGVYYGYKIFKGKMNRAVLAFVVIISLVLSVMIDISILVIALLLEGVPLSIIMELLVEPEIISIFFSDFAMSILFVGIGIYAVWNQISVTNRHGIKNIESAKGTLVPSIRPPAL